MKTEYFAFVTFAIGALICLALRDALSFCISAGIADLIGIAIFIDNNRFKQSKN
jgi:hypothetical protein